MSAGQVPGDEVLLVGIIALVADGALRRLRERDQALHEGGAAKGRHRLKGSLKVQGLG